jgi:glycosyltransferase involved in cell wall biosynthesis
MLRVAYTLEQCWNRVPGGTAGAALAVASAIDNDRDTLGVDLIGVSARHRVTAPAPWTPTIAVRSLPLPRLALFEAWHLARRPPVEVATGTVDVIHATGLAIAPRSKPLVATVHDLAFLHTPEMFTAKGRRFFAQALKLLRSEVDLVLCSSEATRDDCVANGFDADRLRLVPLGVRSEPASAEQRISVRERYGLRGPFVLWLGTLEPRKNVGRVIAAFEALDDPELTLVLAGPDGWHLDDASAADALGRLGDRVVRTGQVSGADRDALYSEAEFFCFPSLREGFGLPVLEAMAQGTTVITSKGTSTEEVAGDCGLLVDPTDTAQITAAMDALRTDEALRSRLSEAGIARAAHFSWERTAERTTSAYRELA